MKQRTYASRTHASGNTCIRLLGVLLIVTLMPAVGLGFSPQRTFPDTADGIYVFVDQLGSLTVAQRQFAASHYVGTQKQTSNLIDAIRMYNPNFIMIQYRLGVRDSGHSANFIHNNTWSNDWATINANEDWFLHDNQGNRVYQLYAGWLEEYCMDVSGLIDHNPGGDPAYGWKEYWSDTVISDITASHGDGVFADSTHLPYAVPSDLWDSPLGSPPHQGYIGHMEVYYDYVYQRFDQADKYFIPNIGGLMTTLDTTNGYYEDVHGAMVEGFGHILSEFDWRLQMNRVLRLLRNDKIFIAQNNVSDHSDVAGRQWLLANFLLLKHNKSYINMFSSADTQLYWWPEYDLDLGAQEETTVPGDVSALRDASGIYVRRYEKALVLVNPTGSARTYVFAPDEPNELVEPWGGGAINASGNMVRPAGLNLIAQGGSIMLPAWSSAILVPEPASVALIALGGLALLRRKRR